MTRKKPHDPLEHCGCRVCTGKVSPPDTEALEAVPDELVEAFETASLEAVHGHKSTSPIAEADTYVRGGLIPVLAAHERMVLARIEALADEEPEPEPEDSCSLVDIDGETVRVHGSGEMGEEGHQALTEVFRAARARMKAEKEAERAEIERQVRAKLVEQMQPVHDEAMSKVQAYGTTYPVDVVGKCIEIARGGA